MVAELLVKDRNNANLIRYLFTLRPTTVGPRRETEGLFSARRAAVVEHVTGTYSTGSWSFCLRIKVADSVVHRPPLVRRGLVDAAVAACPRGSRCIIVLLS